MLVSRVKQTTIDHKPLRLNVMFQEQSETPIANSADRWVRGLQHSCEDRLIFAARACMAYIILEKNEVNRWGGCVGPRNYASVVLQDELYYQMKTLEADEPF